MSQKGSSVDSNSLVVEPTAGDFPHARRRGVRLACCTCTTCCFTLLLGGIGGIAGLITGAASAKRYALQIENPTIQMVVNALWLLGVVIAYGLVGVLVGGGVGYAIDMLVSK